jgi:hypothetical protein
MVITRRGLFKLLVAAPMLAALPVQPFEGLTFKGRLIEWDVYEPTTLDASTYSWWRAQTATPVDPLTFERIEAGFKKMVASSCR